MEDNYRVIKLNLQLFAKEGPGGEKTEPATPKKLEKAREEGQVAKSQDLNTAILLLILFLCLNLMDIAVPSSKNYEKES